MAKVLQSPVSSPAIPLKNSLERIIKARVEATLITPDSVRQWESPPFQRPLRVNAKVTTLAEEIRQNGGVVHGTLTLGVLAGRVYLLDGQHRREAFLISGLPEGYAEMRYAYFEDMASMGQEFVKLNSRLVNMRPDDMLRGLEDSSPALQLIRSKAPFIGYGMIRRNPNAPILSMSQVLRCWTHSQTETPASSSAPALVLAQTLNLDEANHCGEFVVLAKEAWGRDPEYARLWSSLNLTLCMWLYRRLVLLPGENEKPMTRDLFRTALLGLSTDGIYLDWLVGRNMTERDRAPAYKKIKALFKKRLSAAGKRVTLPHPAWENSTS
ncbi:MAG: hypothetical protein ACHREM_00580 [Polyangiales bacterium]